MKIFLPTDVVDDADCGSVTVKVSWNHSLNKNQVDRVVQFS